MALQEIVRGYRMGRAGSLPVDPRDIVGLNTAMIPAGFEGPDDYFDCQILMDGASRAERAAFYIGMLSRPTVVYAAIREARRAGITLGR